MKLVGLDIFIIAAYFVGIVSLGIWISRRQAKGGREFFLAGRKMTWPVIGASLFATNISSQQFVGQAGLAFTVGIIAGGFQMIGAMCFMFLAVFFIQSYMGLSLTTSPEFYERRYSTGCRTIVSFINLMMVLLANLAAALYAGATVLTHLFGWDASSHSNELFWLAVILMGAAAGTYTLLGGLKAVMICNFIEMCVLVLGGVLLLIFGIIEVGGIREVLNFNASDGASMWSLSLPWYHEYGWLPMLTGTVILGVHGHCTNQDYVQRALSAGSLYHAKMGAIFGGFLKVGALFFIAAPGVVAAKLVSMNKLVVPMGDSAYVALLTKVMPAGFLGLCLAGLVAAIMSSVDAGLCSCGSLINYDFFAKLKRNASDKLLLVSGRVIMFLIIVGCIILAPFIRNFKGLFDYLLQVWALLAPPVFVSVVFGLYYKRANAKGAFVTLLVGCVLGFCAFITLNAPNPAFFEAREVSLGSALSKRINAKKDLVSDYLLFYRSKDTRKLANLAATDKKFVGMYFKSLAGDINRQLGSTTFHKVLLSSDVKPSKEMLSEYGGSTAALEEQRLELLNRRLLEKLYPEIPKVKLGATWPFRKVYVSLPEYLRNKLNVGFVITIICAIVMFLVSHFTEHTEEDKRRAEYVAQSKNVMPMTREESRKYNIFITTLIILMAIVLWFFSPLGIAK
jgi:SSS family solute:Na+ symporter